MVYRRHQQHRAEGDHHEHLPQVAEDEQPGGGDDQQRDAIGQPLGDEDRGGAGDGGAVHLAQQVALQPFAHLARRDHHAQAGEEDEEAIACGEPSHLDQPQVVLPLHEAEEIVHRCEDEDEREQRPVEVAQAAAYLAEVGVEEEPGEDDEPQQEREEQLTAQVLHTHVTMIYRSGRGAGRGR